VDMDCKEKRLCPAMMVEAKVAVQVTVTPVLPGVELQLLGAVCRTVQVGVAGVTKLKSLAFVPVMEFQQEAPGQAPLLRVSGEFPVFVSVTVIAADVVLCAWLPNATGLGVRVATAGETPDPESVVVADT
jgi:hypothetical protein